MKPARTKPLALLVLCLTGSVLASALKPDETVVLPPAVACLSTNGTSWDANVHVWVFESEPRHVPLAALQQSLRWGGTEATAGELKAMRSRAKWFLVDNEGGKKLGCRLGNTFQPLAPTEADGWSHTDMSFTNLTIPPEFYRTGKPSRVQWELTGEGQDAHAVAHGDLWLIPPVGVSVISDIDDTIKISEVRDRAAMLERTFLRDFEAVPGMAQLYARLNASNNLAFHYVSGSPWPLYVELSEFCRTNGFPAGSFHLRGFRWRKAPLQALLAPTEKHKAPIITKLFESSPQRRFILVGDSGEADPEIYGVIARRFPAQIARILIRDVTGESPENLRYSEAFEGVPAHLWTVFRDPGEVKVK